MIAFKMLKGRNKLAVIAKMIKKNNITLIFYGIG